MKHQRNALGCMLLVIWGLVAPTAHAATSLADAAEGLFEPVLFITVMMKYVCYVLGFALALGAGAQYRLHRQNPKLTPLLTPIIMLFLGVIVFFLPHISTMFGNSWNAQEQLERGSYGDIEAGSTSGRVRPEGEPYGGSDAFWGDNY